jgi:hypothetical protein
LSLQKCTHIPLWVLKFVQYFLNTDTHTLICFGLFFIIFFDLLLALFFTLCAGGLHCTVLISGGRNEGFSFSIELVRSSVKHNCCVLQPIGGITRQYIKYSTIFMTQLKRLLPRSIDSDPPTTIPVTRYATFIVIYTSAKKMYMCSRVCVFSRVKISVFTCRKFLEILVRRKCL